LSIKPKAVFCWGDSPAINKGVNLGEWPGQVIAAQVRFIARLSALLCPHPIIWKFYQRQLHLSFGSPPYLFWFNNDFSTSTRITLVRFVDGITTFCRLSTFSIQNLANAEGNWYANWHVLTELKLVTYLRNSVELQTNDFITSRSDIWLLIQLLLT
jgi:hypothetical protein